MLNGMASQLAEDRRSLPEAELLIKKALLALNTQPKSSSVTGDWAIEKQVRHRQLMTTYARTLEQQGKDADAFAAYREVMNPDDVDNSDPRTNELYFLCAV